MLKVLVGIVLAVALLGGAALVLLGLRGMLETSLTGGVGAAASVSDTGIGGTGASGTGASTTGDDEGGTNGSAAPEATPTPASPSPTPEATLPATPALSSATWSTRDDEGGRTLMIVPAPWARDALRDPAQITEVVEHLWSELIAAVPEADTTGMHDQFLCHAWGAPDKASWNIEPWRPDVGLTATLAARCNPR